MKSKEIELKLVVGKANLKKLLALDFVAGAIRPDSCSKRRLLSRYYDTEKLDFKAHGIAYRVRDKGDGSYEATVKAAVQDGAGLSERLELNLPVPSARPVLEGFGELGLGCELEQLAPAGVKRLFTVSVQRTSYILDLEGAVCELSVDHGKITAGKQADKIDELEIELLEGDLGAMLAFTAQIAAQIPVFVEKRSKYARGLALCGVSVEAEEAKYKIGGGSLRQELLPAIMQLGDALLSRQNALRSSTDVGLLKELRRQLTQLRALTFLGSAATEAAPALGELEVLLAAVERIRSLRALQRLWQLLAEKGEGLWNRTPLQKRLQEAVDESWQQLQQLAEQGKFTALVYALAGWLYKLDWEQADMPAQEAARQLIKQWSAELQETEAAAARRLLAENIYALARCCSGKYFAKAAGSVRKQRRQLIRQAVRSCWWQELQELCTGSTSKLLYRDVGVVLGYMLAAER